MSLIGSLEDLSLGDILQIISLSQKSGVLNIRGEEGDGQILFRDGMVRAAQVKGGAQSLRDILVDGGFVSGEDFSAALEHRGGSLEDALAVHASISRERIDSLRREAVESAVVMMFSWRTGEFSFDVGNEQVELEESLLLPMGVNAQYLAMEGLRLRDEATRADGDASEAPIEYAEVVDAADPVEGGSEIGGLDSAASAEAFFGIGSAGQPEAPDPAAVDVLAAAAADAILDCEPLPIESNPGILESPTLSDQASPFAPAPAPAPAPASAASEEVSYAEESGASQSEVGSSEASPETTGQRPPVVVIEPELAVLEWVKGALSDAFGQVHIFQRSEQGLIRIRQYLSRAQTPLLLVSPSIEGNPLSGIPDGRDFVQRLKKQAPSMQVLWLAEEGDEEVEESDGPADGRVWRPPVSELSGDAQPVAGGGALCAELLARLAPSPEPARAGAGEPAVAVAAPMENPSLAPDGLDRLEDVTAALRDVGSRGDVLPLVIRFASERFSRVAMFMVRGEQVAGIAQAGFEVDGGPNDLEIRAMSFDKGECGWFGRVIDERKPLRGPAGDDGDRRLLTLLGGISPDEAYLAPIESGGQVVAILYADNLPESQPIEDTSALEVVLQQAGLALDRAALERALAQAEDEASG